MQFKLKCIGGFLIILCTFFCSPIKAQEIVEKKNIILTSSPIKYFPNYLNSAVVNLGIERYSGNANSYKIEFGMVKSYGISQGYFRVPANENYGLYTCVEKRKYLNKYKLTDPLAFIFWPMVLQYNTVKQDNAGYYYSVLCEYNWNNVTRNSTEPVVHDYTILRHTIGFYLNFGYQTTKQNNLVFDQTIGFGIQYIGSKTQDYTEYNDTQDFQFNPYHFGTKDFNSGNKIFFSIRYDFLIGYKI